MLHQGVEPWASSMSGWRSTAELVEHNVPNQGIEPRTSRVWSGRSPTELVRRATGWSRTSSHGFSNRCSIHMSYRGVDRWGIEPHPRLCKSQGLTKQQPRVELRGFEPRAFGLPDRRSTELSYNPLEREPGIEPELSAWKADVIAVRPYPRVQLSYERRGGSRTHIKTDLQSAT